MKKEWEYETTTDHWDVKSLCARYGMSPLEYLLKVMSDDALPLQLRSEAARAAAPFVHPKVASTDISNLRSFRSSIYFNRLTTEELIQLERIIVKAGIITPVDPA